MRVDKKLIEAWAASSDNYAWNVSRAQGGRWDPTSGLVYHERRDLSPTLGRWMQQDPAGYVDGGSRYQFVRSRPISFSDPLGLCTDGATVLAFPIDRNATIAVSPTDAINPDQLNAIVNAADAVAFVAGKADGKNMMSHNAGIILDAAEELGKNVAPLRFVWVRMVRGTCVCGSWNWGDPQWFVVPLDPLGRGDTVDKGQLNRGIAKLRSGG